MPEPKITNIRDLVFQWGDTPGQAYSALAAALGEHLGRVVRAHVPRDWARRGSIPSEYIDAVVSVARKRGLRIVTHEFLARLLAEEAA